jgi:hypothetical protein
MPIPWFGPAARLPPSSQPYIHDADARRSGQDRPPWAAEGLVLRAPSTTARSIDMGEDYFPLSANHPMPRSTNGKQLNAVIMWVLAVRGIAHNGSPGLAPVAEKKP